MAGLNGAWLALGVAGAVALAGRAMRGSFDYDWRAKARKILADEADELYVSPDRLAAVLESITLDTKVSKQARSSAYDLLEENAGAGQFGYGQFHIADAPQALAVIRAALKSGSRKVYGMDPSSAGRTLKLGSMLPQQRSHAGEAMADYRWHRQSALAQLAASAKGKRKAKGGSRKVYGMDPSSAGRTLKIGTMFPQDRSHAGEAMADYRWHRQSALAQLAASTKGKRKAKGGSRGKGRRG